jgi:hypothetical protein
MLNDTPVIPANPVSEVLSQPHDGGVTEELGLLANMAAKLEKLSPAARDRVLNYLVAKYQSPRPLARATGPSAAVSATMPTPTDSTFPTDIRSFRESKAPANGQEMAAILAFYLSEVGPEDERRQTVSPVDVEKYFKQAGFPLPARSRSVLFNAKAAGYLEEASTRGEYKLSPVGYNLVKYRLPRNADNPSPAKSLRRRTRRGPIRPDGPTSNKNLNVAT